MIRVDVKAPTNKCVSDLALFRNWCTYHTKYICKWMLYRKLHTETNMKENRHMIITYTVSGLPWFQTKLLTQTLRTCDAAETNTWGDSWWHRVWCFHYVSFIFMGCNNWFFGTYLVDFIQTSPVPRCCLPHMTEIARMRQSTSRW